MNNINDKLTINKKITLTGVFSALIVVLGITNLGIIPIAPTASVTILQIPVILIVILTGLPEGLFVGAVFGIYSLVHSAISPTGIIGPLFLNPLCSVLPRVLIAVVAWAVWSGLNKIPKFNKILSVGITAFITTIAHTFLVAGAIYVFEGAELCLKMGKMGYFAFVGTLLFNAVLESIVATVVCVAVYSGLFLVSNRKSKLSIEVEDLR